MKKIALVSTILVSACSVGFAASLTSLNKSQTMKTFEDKTITTIPLVNLHQEMVSDNPVTIYFGKDGKMKGHFATKPANDPQDDEGTWKVKNNGEMCVLWNNWEANKELCVNMYKFNNAIVFINTNNHFESMVLNDKIQEGDKV